MELNDTNIPAATSQTCRPVSASSSEDDESFNIWTIPKPPPPKKAFVEKACLKLEERVAPMQHHQAKFEALRQRRTEIQDRVKLGERRKEKQKAKKIARKELKNAVAQQTSSCSATSDGHAGDVSSVSSVSINESKTEGEWTKVSKYLDVNSHLAGPVDHGWCGPKSNLERQMETALQKGDASEAEDLSDQMARRQFASRVHEAFEARKFAEEQTKVKEIEKAKQSKKLHWGFEAKQRWETKGNL